MAKVKITNNHGRVRDNCIFRDAEPRSVRGKHWSYDSEEKRLHNRCKRKREGIRSGGVNLAFIRSLFN